MRVAGGIAIAAALAAFGSISISADDGDRALRARLAAVNEVPAVISQARGEFRAKVNDDAPSIEYELSYRNLEGSVTQAHIHVGQRFAAGGIMIWLCSNLASPPTPAGVQPCPAAPGTITGTITPADVVGPAGQGVNPGNFADALKAIREGVAYVNVHSTVAGSGELRGQVR
jgi:hypothetical protein